MLDEVEYITHGLGGALGRHWNADFIPFWQTIRSVHQETKGKLTFIVAGVNPSCVETSHFDSAPNPIFQLAPPQYLEPLTTKSVRTMVRSIGRYDGFVFEEGVYDYLQKNYGGHPYLIRIACSELWRATDTRLTEKRATVSISTFENLRPQIKDRLSQPLKDILLSLVWWYPEEYDLLRILADGDQEFVREYLDTQHDSVVQFARYGILRESGDFAISDVREFLRKHGQNYKKEVSPFTRTDMPPELLPEVPDLELLGQLFQKRCEIEIGLRKLIIMYLGVKANWDPLKMAKMMTKGIQKRPGREKGEDLFVGRTPQEVINDLYTLELKTIIADNWEVFGPLFDQNKGRFEMNMDTINRARRVDAHSKPVSRDDATEFDNSYLWIRTRLQKLPNVL